MRIASRVAPQFCNFVRSLHQLEYSGVCGIGTKSTIVIDNFNKKPHELLAHLLSATVESCPMELRSHRISLNNGPHSINSILKNCRGVKIKQTAETGKNIFLASGAVEFYLVTGGHSISKPLTEDAVLSFFHQTVRNEQKFIPSPLPLVRDEFVSFQIGPDVEGFSEVTFNGITDEEARKFVTQSISEV